MLAEFVTQSLPIGKESGNSSTVYHRLVRAASIVAAVNYLRIPRGWINDVILCNVSTLPMVEEEGV